MTSFSLCFVKLWELRIACWIQSQIFWYIYFAGLANFRLGTAISTSQWSLVQINLNVLASLPLQLTAVFLQGVAGRRFSAHLGLPFGVFCRGLLVQNYGGGAGRLQLGRHHCPLHFVIVSLKIFLLWTILKALETSWWLLILKFLFIKKFLKFFLFF